MSFDHLSVMLLVVAMKTTTKANEKKDRMGMINEKIACSVVFFCVFAGRTPKPEAIR